MPVVSDSFGITGYLHVLKMVSADGSLTYVGDVHDVDARLATPETSTHRMKLAGHHESPASQVPSPG